ncbi:MAG: hypothetical protein JSU77_08270 [Fidelibacterota bacterium]|nr:MAG: hypothetical protein JSU77_08270 [Candidatus Neomarinimicrobiota bacterium]
MSPSLRMLTTLDEIKNETKGLELGATDSIIKPIRLPILLARVGTQLAFYDLNRALGNIILRRSSELHDIRLEMSS